MNKFVLFLLIISLVNCSQKQSAKDSTLSKESLQDRPLPFKPELTPKGMLIHGGSFSPDLKTYLFTLSDTQYQRFDVWMIEQTDGKWSEPKRAFFNSEFSEHGARYAPDGKALYFSSTRPTGKEGFAETWHIWRSEKQQSGWSEPSLVDIPNLRDKSVSHPSITESGTLYFHVSQPDYSEMTLYMAQEHDGKFREAQKLAITQNGLNCTPFVSADGQTLIYAAIGNQLDLMLSRKTADGVWGKPMILDKQINTNGQGNPYLTPDGKYLFYATGTETQDGKEPDWQVNRVDLSIRLTTEND